MNNTTMTDTKFDNVAGLDELAPDFWSEFLTHPKTTIEIKHDGRPLYRGNFRASRVRSRRIYDGKEYSAKISLAVETKLPDRWDATEDEDDGDESADTEENEWKGYANVGGGNSTTWR